MTNLEQADLKTGKRPVQQQIVNYKTGDILFEEGTTGRELYIIQDGRVGVYKNTLEGRIELAVIQKNGIFGEMSLLDNLPRSATVTALEPTSVVVVNHEVFLSVMQNIPMWLQSIVKIVVSRLRDANKRVDQPVLRDRERGITSLMLLLLPSNKKEINSSLALDYNLVMIEAYFVCRLRKKEIKRILEVLEKRELILNVNVKETGGHDIVIKDLEVLRLFDEYLFLKSLKQSFKETTISENLIATLSNIAYVAQKSGQETEDGTILMKSALIEDLSDEDSSRLEKDLLELRRKNLINMFPLDNDISIIFKIDVLSRIKKIKEWLPKFSAEIS